MLDTVSLHVKIRGFLPRPAAEATQNCYVLFLFVSFEPTLELLRFCHWRQANKVFLRFLFAYFVYFAVGQIFELKTKN